MLIGNGTLADNYTCRCAYKKKETQGGAIIRRKKKPLIVRKMLKRIITVGLFAPCSG